MKLTEENKNLLMQYICASIPFGLKAQITLDSETFKQIDTMIKNPMYESLMELWHTENVSDNSTDNK